MWYIKKSCFTITTILVCAAFLYSQEQKVAKIPLPKNPHKEDIVSSDLACKIASITVQKRFGKGVIGEPLIGYDLNGNVRAYIVPYRIGKSVFLPETEILNSLNEARRWLPEMQKELAIVRERTLASKRAEIRFEKRGKRMFLIKNAEWTGAEEKVKNIENKCWGVGEYGTVVVSGRKDMIPIPEYSNGLPYYYTYHDIAEELAKEKLDSNVFLSRFYYGGDLDQIFEFESNNGDKIWVAIFPPRVVKPGEITPREIEVTEEQRKQIKKMWNEIMMEVQDEK